jgi:hypothetical protein
VFRRLAPSGRAATIGILLRNGGYSFAVKSPVNGRLAIAWYRVPTGASVAQSTRQALVARGSADIASGRMATITIRLTTAGTRALATARTLKITARGTFTPVLGVSVAAARTFTLTR